MAIMAYGHYGGEFQSGRESGSNRAKAQMLKNYPQMVDPKIDWIPPPPPLPVNIQILLTTQLNIHLNTYFGKFTEIDFYMIKNQYIAMQFDGTNLLTAPVRSLTFSVTNWRICNKNHMDKEKDESSIQKNW